MVLGTEKEKKTEKMFRNQFGDFIDLDPEPQSSNFVDADPDTINTDQYVNMYACVSLNDGCLSGLGEQFLLLPKKITHFFCYFVK